MKYPRINVAGLDICAVTMSTATNAILEWANDNVGRYVCLSNAHMCVESHFSPELKDCVNNADLALPDGKPLHWVQMMHGTSKTDQIRGYDYTIQLLEMAHSHKLSIGFFGGQEHEQADFLNAIQSRYTGARIEFAYAPPFLSISDMKSLDIGSKISAAHLDILFVGLGCPKQELLMAHLKPQVNCTMIGVGAVFDFLLGSKPMAPIWMQRIGLEWLFRLASEPRRLAKRYVIYNPLFIYLACRHWFKRPVDAPA